MNDGGRFARPRRGTITSMQSAKPAQARWLTIVMFGTAALLLVAAGLMSMPAEIVTQAGSGGAAMLATMVATWLAVPAAFLAARAGRAQRAKFSDDLDAVSRRLLRLEERIDRPLLEPAADASPLDDIAEDIGSLSRVVRDLAETAAGHERAIAALGTAAHPAQSGPDADPRSPVEFEAVVPSFFPVRESSSAEAAAPPAADRRSRAGYASILDALEAERIELHVQPVVSLPQRQVRLYESFALLQTASGEALLPAEFMPTLDRLRRLPRLDAFVVREALALARRIRPPRRPVPISCSVSPSAFADPDFRASLDRLLGAQPFDRSLVFEMPQRAWQDADPLMLARCRDAGISFALHEIQDFDLDPGILAKCGVHYVKIPASTFLDAQRQPGGARNIATSPHLFAGSGVEIVAECVEDDAVVPELIDLEISLAQGYAFALPCPASALFPSADEAGTAAAAGAPSEPLADTLSKAAYRPLRDFLRRAG